MFFQTKQAADSDLISRLRTAIEQADAIVTGAGSGLSTSAGFTYAGERFDRYFSDFETRYGFHDMYTGGFYPYETFNEYWAFWSRYIYVNRFMDPPGSVYSDLLALLNGTDYFVLTTNVDHCFQKAGFDKHRLFYTQGDYGLFQCSVPCCQETYENESIVRDMLKSQGFSFGPDGGLMPAQGAAVSMEIPAELIPRCPHCGRPMAMNLRSDNTFVQDAGWDAAAERYSLFIRRHEGLKVLYLELGVGYNTPGIIKYPFWQMTAKNPKAVYACVNCGDAAAPSQIRDRSILIDDDIGTVLKKLRKL